MGRGCHSAYEKYVKAGGKYHPRWKKKIYFRHNFWCYKQVGGSVHCGYYTCVFASSSSAYLEHIVEESDEERAIRERASWKAKMKKNDKIRKGEKERTKANKLWFSQ